MKKFLFLQALFFLSTILSLSTGCSNDEEVVPDLTFTLGQTEASIGAAGGKISIDYSLSLDGNARPEFALISKEGWVKSLSVNGGQIVIDVASNQQQVSRSTTIGILHVGSGLKQELTITQEAAPAIEPDFVIDTISVTESTITIKVIPKDKNMRYSLMLMDKSYHDELPNDVALFNLLINEYAANAGNMSLSEYLDAQLRVGDLPEVTFQSLSRLSKYMIFAVGMSLDGKQLTDFYKLEVTTHDIPRVNLTIKTEINPVNGPDVDIRYIPNDDQIMYFSTVFSDEEFSASGKSLSEYMQEKVTYAIGMAMYFEGYGKKKATISICNQGTTTKSYREFKENTKYISVACGVDANTGIINSELSSEEFTTGELKKSENNIEIEVSEVGLDKLIFKINTTNDDPYTYYFDYSRNWGENVSDDEIIRFLEGYKFLTEYHGTKKFEKTSLKPGEEYIIFACGYHKGSQRVTTTQVQKVRVKMESEAASPENMTFTFDLRQVTTSSVGAFITGTPATALYYTQLRESPLDVQALKEDLENSYQQMKQQGYVKTKAEFMKLFGERGTSKFSRNNLKPSTEYSILAVGIYEETGEFAMEPVIYNFKTKDAKVSDATIEVKYDQYFDGTEIAEKYSEYSSAKGFAVVPVYAQLGNGGESFLMNIYEGNYLDSDKYGDEYIISVLKDDGYNQNFLSLCRYDLEYTLLGVAMDAEGGYGKVFRKTCTFSKDGVSPIDEFAKLIGASVKEENVKGTERKLCVASELKIDQ
jgi:hypothetical protein